MNPTRHLGLLTLLAGALAATVLTAATTSPALPPRISPRCWCRILQCGTSTLTDARCRGSARCADG